MRIVFCGNPAFALPTFDALHASRHEILVVVSSPDKPRGRGRKMQPLPVKEHASELGIPVLQPVRLKDPEFLKNVQSLDADALVVVAFRILPRELFAMPRLGSFNVHPSLLPRGRGPAPIPWTLIRGEPETGVTIIRLSETIDGGDILAQERTPIEADDNFGTLHDRLAQLGARLLVRVLDACDSGRPPMPIAQDDSAATPAPKLFPADFRIDWTQSALQIRNRIRAFSPDPGAVAGIGPARLKILSADVVSVPVPLEPGGLRREGTDRLLAGTGAGTLRLNIVQPEGKRAMTTAEFLRGRPALPNRFDLT
ncbi:MAG: methionyl-tRNA formyltransferase [bacterium]|nr:methionyl-tRNA formyltransferase [bacterium]